MAGKTNTSATFFAQKKLLGKAHTSNLKTDGEELIGSNIQAASSLIFGQQIPENPAQTLYLLQSGSNGGPVSVEYIHFALEALTGTTYDANETSPDGGAGSDSGESSQISGVHTYKFKFRSDYESNSSNPKKGNGLFNNNSLVHESLGKVQLIPPFFSQTAPNPYIVKIYKDNGSGGIGDEIPLLDNVDWNVDFYNGILFLQDFNASKIPAHAKAFAYVGDFADSGFFENSLSGSLQNLTDGSSYLVAGNNVTITSASNGQITISSTGGGGGGGSVAGSDTQVQFNDGGSFGGDSGLVYNKTTNTLTTDNLSGSLTKLSDGKSYLVAGDNVTITSASNGQVTIASTQVSPAGSDTQIQFNNNGAFGASSAFTFDGTEITLHENSPTINLRRTNNNQSSDIDFKGAGGVVGAQLRFSGSASNDLVFSTFTSSKLKERLRIRSNIEDVSIEATGSLRVTNGISGSLTQLIDGTSYILSNGSISVTTQSNGSILLSAANSVFNEYIGEADGSNTRFTLDHTPTANKNVSVFVNGQLQMPATNITGAPFQDYSVTGSVIHFVTASLPLEGSLLMANYTTNQSIS